MAAKSTSGAPRWLIFQKEHASIDERFWEGILQGSQSSSRTGFCCMHVPRRACCLLWLPLNEAKAETTNFDALPRALKHGLKKPKP